MHRLLVVLGCGLGGVWLLALGFLLRAVFLRRRWFVPGLLVVGCVVLLLLVLLAPMEAQHVR